MAVHKTVQRADQSEIKLTEGIMADGRSFRISSKCETVGSDTHKIKLMKKNLSKLKSVHTKKRRKKPTCSKDCLKPEL